MFRDYRPPLLRCQSCKLDLVHALCEDYLKRVVDTIASNPMVTQANSKLVYQALKSLDLYVVKDFWLTPGAQLADYVLPTACWAERPDVLSAFGSDTRIIAGEAGLPAVVPGEYVNLRQFMDQRDGVHFPRDQHKKYERLEGFGTPTRKLELYSTILEVLDKSILQLYY